MGLLHLNGTLYMKDQAYSLTKNKCPIMVHYYYQCCWVELHALYSSLLENTMELSKMRVWANIYQAFSMCHVLTKPQDYSKRWVLWYPHLVPTRKLRHEGLTCLKLHSRRIEKSLHDEEQGSLACCSPQGHKESVTNEQLNSNNT